MPNTYNDLYLETRRVLRGQGISAYNLEARLLAAHASGKTTERFLRDINLYATAEVSAKLAGLLERRLQGEPVAYITGSWEFYGLPFNVTPDTLIPRADTETLADTAIKKLRNKNGARVLDLCAGSGCIGCAIAANLPEIRVVFVDNNEDTLDVCRSNVYLNGLQSRASFVLADVTEAPPGLIGSFDLAACNPPYIKSAEIPLLDGSVRDYEPVAALDGGEDGLDFYRAVLNNWAGVLSKNALLCFEVGAGQSGEVKELMRFAGFEEVAGVYDTIAVERVVYGRL